MPNTAAVVIRGPTIATLRVLEKVISESSTPLSRYEIRKRLANRIAPPMLDEALEYLADHEMVYDEGPGGKVLWIRASSATAAMLRRR